jgi:hypothetical protein
MKSLVEFMLIADGASTLAFVKKMRHSLPIAILLVSLMEGCAHSPVPASPIDDIAGIVRSDLKSGICQFLCSNAGIPDDEMHIPGLNQIEVDTIMRDYEVTLTWYIYDGHEFDIGANGKIDTSAVERKWRHAEQYNRCLFELLTKSAIFPKKKTANRKAGGS